MRRPISFAMPAAPFMRIVSCGMPYIPERSARPTSLGREHWMFSSAVGAAYLSRCAEGRVQACLNAGIAEHDAGNANFIPERTQMITYVKRVRTAGYALRIATTSDVNSAMAVPVFTGDWIIGAIACSTFPRSLSRSFIEDVFPPLVETAAKIALACGCVGMAASA